MRQHVKRCDLRPGMLVVSYGRGDFDDPLVKVGKPIIAPRDVERLVPEEIDDVVVEAEAGERSGTNLAEEMPVAKRLYAEAIVHAKTFMTEARRGANIDVRRAEPLVRDFIASVFRNESAAVTLFKLRGFDEYTYTHSINVSLFAVLLGKHLGLKKTSLLSLGLAGMYHDIGKARIPEAILNKPGRLTETEFAVMKTHPLEGYKILSQKPDADPDILRAVVEHHERYDGSGYPQGLSGNAIGLFPRIIGIVDVYDALTSRRVYKEPMAPSKALSLLYQWRDRDFPLQAVENFIRCVGVYPIGSLIRLSNGECGVVASANPLAAMRPKIKIILDADLRPQMPRLVDLAAPAEEGAPRLDIVEALNPADYNINLERFIAS